MLSRVHLFATPQTAAHQASLSITNSHLCSLPDSWQHLSLLSSEKQTSSCRLWGKCIPRKPLLPGFHGKLPSAEEQGSHSKSQEQTDGHCPNAINKGKKLYFTFLFSYFLFLELHVIMGLTLDILGSIACGYWCARIIQFILTDLFSNTLTNLIFCISMVYMTFYIGKTETDTKIPSLMCILCF